MNNEGGIEKLSRPITCPSQTMDIDMDIVMAYNQSREKKNTDKKHDKKINITPFEWDNVE